MTELDATQCPHRRPLTPIRYANRLVPIISCALIDAEVGWTHGCSLRLCEACCAGRSDFPAVVSPQDSILVTQIQAALRTRLIDPRGDADPTNPWRPGSPHECSRQAAAERAARWLTPVGNGLRAVPQEAAPAAAPERHGLGDIIHALAHPVAGAIDSMFGTRLQSCGGCAERRRQLNMF